MHKLIIAGVLLGLAGCNTVQGFGKDLQTVGGVLTGTAEGVQRGASPSSPPPASRAPADTCQPDADGLVLDGCPTPQ